MKIMETWKQIELLTIPYDHGRMSMWRKDFTNEMTVPKSLEQKDRIGSKLVYGTNWNDEEK
jgi:hypothetical protein